MIIQDLRLSLPIGLLSGLLLLQGCATPPVVDEVSLIAPTAVATTRPDTPSPRKKSRQAKPVPEESMKAIVPTVELANVLLKQGRKEEAADMYYRSAFGFPSPQRERVILQAAEISASLGDQQTTQQYLQRIPRQALQGENLPRYQYTLALLALQSNQANQSLRLLPQDLNPVPGGLREKILLVRKRAIEMGGRLPPSAQALAQANELPGVQAPTAPQAPENILPAASNNLAVLLPDSGALGAVSKEIYQGMQDARQQFAGTQTKFYPVTPGNALSQYQQAVAEGADMVIGPLDKDSLDALLASPAALTTPILSLNYSTSGQAPASLYQFGLSPEDEARQIAEVTTGKGQRQAVVMVPDSIWGSRLAEAFTAAYQANGGQVISTLAYPNSAASSYLDKVKATLANSTGVQMVFLGASPTQARLIRPLLQAQAADLPVYATSHIFSGNPEKDKDTDLNGIVYTEIPWVLDNIQQGNSLDSLKYPRLYALGIDAVLIAKNLPALSQRQVLPGKTGSIRLGGDRHIQRRLSMATFSDGLPNRLE